LSSALDVQDGRVLANGKELRTDTPLGEAGLLGDDDAVLLVFKPESGIASACWDDHLLSKIGHGMNIFPAPEPDTPAPAPAPKGPRTLSVAWAARWPLAWPRVRRGGVAFWRVAVRGEGG
jgi:hypothetical protein